MLSNVLIFLTLLTPVFLFIFMYSLGFAVKPIPAIVLFATMFSFLIFYVSLDMGLYIALFLNPFDRLTALHPRSFMTITKIVIIVLGLALLARIFFEKDTRLVNKLYDSPLTICAYFFLLFSLISIVNAHDYRIFLLQIIRRFSIVTLYIIIITVVDNRKKLDRILKIMLFAYFFVASTGLYELFSEQGILEARFGKWPLFALPERPIMGIRISGPYGDPDFYAVSMIFPTLLSSMFFYLSQSKKKKLIMLGLFCFFVLNVIGTSSRGGLIAVLIGLFAMWWFVKIRWKSVIAIAAIILFLGVAVVYSVLIPSSSLERYTGLTGRKSIQWRIGLWEMSRSAIQKHPILGIGTGNFVSQYNRYINEEVPRTPLWPHNSILQAWVENGIFGMFSYLLLFILALRNAYRAVKFEEDEHLRSVSITIFATILALFFFASTSNVMEHQDYWILFSFSVVALNFYVTRKN